MNEEESEELVATLQTLKGQRKPWRFVYLAKGADGDAQLVVKRNLPQGKVMEIRGAAKNKSLFTTGWVVAAEDRRSFVFHPEVEPPGKFARDLMQGPLGKLSRLLKTSTIAATGSQPGEGVEGGDVSTLKSVGRESTLEASQSQQKATEKQRAVKEAVARYTDLGKRLGETHFAKKNAEELVDKRQKGVDDALTAVEDLQGKWFKGKEKKQAAEKVKSERGRLEDARKELFAAFNERSLALGQLQEVHKLMEASETAVVQAETARAEASRARARAAAAEAVVAEADLAEKERALADALKEKAESDPELKEALDLAATRDAQARQAVSVAMAAQDKVGALEAKLADAKPEEQAELERQLAEAEKELEEAFESAELATTASTSAAESSRAAIRKAATGPLGELLSARDEALGERDAADQREVEAHVAADEAEEVAERNAALRKPKIIVQGLSKADFEMFVSFLPIGDPQTRVDFEKLRVGIGYDALVYAQQNRLAVQQLDTVPPMKGTPGEKLAVRFAAAFGGDAYKQDLQARKDAAAERGRQMVDDFDWDARKLELAGKEDALDDALAGKSGGDVVKALLSDDQPGALFGESHSDAKTQNFLVDNFDAFVEQGVDTFYIEHITVELQPVVDAWLASDADEMPAPLAKALYAIQVKPDQYPRNLVGLLEKAKKAGMNIRGIDTTAAKGDLDPTCDKDKTERVRRMNSLAGDVMQNDPKRRGKFVALTGAAHNTPHAGSPKPVPGIGDLLGVVPVELDDDGAVKADRGDPSLRP